MSQSVYVVVSHKLTQDEAFARVLKWLGDQKGGTPSILVISVNVQPLVHQIRLSLNIYGYPIEANITVTPSIVEVKTNEATDIIEGAAMWYQQRQLQSELTKILK